MSSSTQPQASGPKEEKERKGLGRVLNRMRTVLRRGEGSSSKRQSMLSTAKPAAALKPSEPTAAGIAAAAKARYEGMAGVTKMSRTQLVEERAKKLSERFGLELSASEWMTTTPDETVLRMDKPIRMRVRRSCHKCNATFGKAKECPNCQHPRCTKCARHPPKRTEEEIKASRERRAALIKANKENAPIIPNYAFEEKEFVLRRPGKKDAQDLIYKKPRQRVRRTCHECQVLFISGNKQCSQCGHNRCTDCPREPSKKDKYPFGYPGDEFGPNSIPHYECEKCKAVYPTDAANGTECKKCATTKSDNSPRAKPRKIEPEPDPEILKAIQAKIESMKISS